MKIVCPNSYQEAFGTWCHAGPSDMLDAIPQADKGHTAASPAPIRSCLTAYDALEAIRDHPDFMVGNSLAKDRNSP